MFKLVGLLISLASLCLLLILGGSPTMYIDIPSVIIMFGIFLGGAFFGYGNNILTFIQYSRAEKISSSQLFATLDFYNYLTRLTLYAALLAFVLATILILAQSSDISTIGPAMALSLLTCMYGVIAAFLIIQPIKHGVLYKNMNPKKATSLPPESEI
mgnify:FL=1